METENSQKLFSVSITHNSKIRELSDGNRVMETKLLFAKQPFLSWVPPFFSNELWKLRIELRKQLNQIASRLSIREVMHVMELERHLKHGQLPFFQRDIRNLYVKMRRKNAKNDAMDLLQFCKVAKEEKSGFQYAFTNNEENRLEHIFWSPTHCFDWYQKMEM